MSAESERVLLGARRIILWQRARLGIEVARNRDTRENALFTIAKQEIPMGFLLLNV